MTASVLFICDDNAILGPMAEAFVKRHGWSTFIAHSAGILAKPIHRYTFRVMEEIGYDLYGSSGKSIFEFNHLERVDFLITLSDIVNECFVFNEDHIGSRHHWPFRNPILESWEAYGSSQLSPSALPLFDPYSIDTGYWLASGDMELATQRRRKLVLNPDTAAQPETNVQDILKRFRRIRDEMECQVMDWLEEQGIGPLWWRR